MVSIVAPRVAWDLPPPESKEFALKIYDDTPDAAINLMIMPSADFATVAAPKMALQISTPATTLRVYRHYIGGASLFQLYGPKSDLTKAYLATRIDYDNDLAIEIVALDNTGGGTGGGGEGTLAQVAGVVKIDGIPQARDVVVIADNAAGRQVVGNGRSAADGSFAITYGGWAGSVIALALDAYGDDWRATRAVNAGAIVHPTLGNGFVYVASNSGTTGATEPNWQTDASTVDGGVTWAPRPYYRPVASGPIKGNVIEPTP